MGEIFLAHLALSERAPYSSGEHPAKLIQSDLDIVRRTFEMRGEHPPRLVDQYESGVSASAVDAEEGFHEGKGNGWMDTPWTTRFTVPAAFGRSGVSPSEIDRSSASVCAKVT